MLIELLIFGGFAALHGYLAAWLAVRMLFRPRYPVKLFGFTVWPQGMIPRHRQRLAEAIGRAVGSELVSQETVIDALFKTDFFAAKWKALSALTLKICWPQIIRRCLKPCPRRCARRCSNPCPRCSTAWPST
ncbi:MAG: DUF445 family protein [Pyrinomonadaceae bacterium]